MNAKQSGMNEAPPAVQSAGLLLNIENIVLTVVARRKKKVVVDVATNIIFSDYMN